MIRNDFMFADGYKIKRHLEAHFLVSYSDGVWSKLFAGTFVLTVHFSTFCFSRSCTPDLVPSF